MADICGDFCSDYSNNPFVWKSPGVGRPLLFMFLQAIAYFAILFFLESGLSKRIQQSVTSRASGVYHPGVAQNVVSLL